MLGTPAYPIPKGRRNSSMPRKRGKSESVVASDSRVPRTRVRARLPEPDAATRNAERPKGEKRELASRLPGNSYSRFARCADGKGLRERYLASRLSYLGYPLEKCATEDAITSFFALVIRQAENDTVAHCAVSALFWNGYPHEMRNEVIGSSERDQRCASLRRKKTKIPVRRTYEQYRLCCRDYPDFSASAPFASALMALFGRERLPHRSTLSRFLASLDQATVDALRALLLEDVLARPVTTEQPGGHWDRHGHQWLIFDVDGTRQAARQRALPQTPDHPSPHRRLSEVCTPGYLGRKRGEGVRTRTTVLQAHTHQWLGTFGGAGNGDYRGDLKRAVAAIQGYLKVQQLPCSQGVVRLDGQYGNGSLVEELAGLGWILRGRDYHLLDLPQVQARLKLPPDQRTTHPETGTQRTLFDCPSLVITATGQRSRVIVATHPASSTPSPVGTTREGVVYELFFTALPPAAFTAADVVALYLHRGAFETVLADEDQEQEPDRWCSHTACGQEFWQILSQWVWNLRLCLGHALHPTPMRTTEFAPAAIALEPAAGLPPTATPSYGPPTLASTWKRGRLEGHDFVPQPDGTLRCPAEHPLYAQERRPERNGTIRVVYAARIGHCRLCPLRERCQWYGPSTKKPRRVSAVLQPLSSVSPTLPKPAGPPGTTPLLWGDWDRRLHRRECMQLLRSQRVDIQVAPPLQANPAVTPSILSRAGRAHWRLSWTQRLARNARGQTACRVTIKLFGVPPRFATFLGLPTISL